MIWQERKTSPPRLKQRLSSSRRQYHKMIIDPKQLIFLNQKIILSQVLYHTFLYNRTQSNEAINQASLKKAVQRTEKDKIQEDTENSQMHQFSEKPWTLHLWCSIYTWISCSKLKWMGPPFYHFYSSKTVLYIIIRIKNSVYNYV